MSVEYYATTPHRYYLEHEGVQGRSGRYPLGSGERPYQRLERAKRKGFFARRKEEKERKAILEKKKKEVEERRKAEEEKAKLLAEKERILRIGTASEIKKILPELTNKELSDAVDRIKWMDTLDNQIEKEKKKAGGTSTFDQFDNLMKRLDKINNWGSIGLNSYRNVQQLQSMLDSSMRRQEQKKKEAERKQKEQKAS